MKNFIGMIAATTIGTVVGKLILDEYKEKTAINKPGTLSKDERDAVENSHCEAESIKPKDEEKFRLWTVGVYEAKCYHDDNGHEFYEESGRPMGYGYITTNINNVSFDGMKNAVKKMLNAMNCFSFNEGENGVSSKLSTGWYDRLEFDDDGLAVLDAFRGPDDYEFSDVFEHRSKPVICIEFRETNIEADTEGCSMSIITLESERVEKLTPEKLTPKNEECNMSTITLKYKRADLSDE